MTAEALASVLVALDRDQEFLLDLTQQLVRIPTVNPKLQTSVELNHEADLQYYLRMVLDGFGMPTQTHDVFPGQPNLVGSLPGNDARSLILASHVDVRPPGERAAWSVDPFGGEIRARRLYGRGALGAKSGLAASVAVARALRRSGVALAGRLDIHAVVDGEDGGFGARDLLARGHRAAALVEVAPTAQALLPAACGQDWGRVTFRGRSAPAMQRYRGIFPQAAGADRPETGVNALEIATRFVLAMQHLERDWTTRRPPHPLLPAGINTIHPGVLASGVGLGADGFPRNLGEPATTPDAAVLDVVLTCLPNELQAELREDFEAFVAAFAQQDGWLREHPPGVRWGLYGRHLPPLHTPADHKLSRAVIDSRAARKLPTEIRGFVGACSAAHYAGAGIPGVLFGPGGGALHEADEYVDIESLKLTAQILAEVALRWCGVV